MQFSDLPNGGHNLRLYTYDPIGSTYGPKNSCGSEPTNTWIYNTGHYDISLGTPCSQPDPQGFCDAATMNAYAGSRGESLVMVTRADLSALCGYRAPAQVVTVPKPVTVITPSAGPGPGTSSLTPVSVGTAPSPAPSPAGYIPPPSTSISDGGLPGGAGTMGSSVNTSGPLTSIYRFILYNPSTTDPNNPWSTGANYPGCSQVNSMDCKGMNFPTEAAAIAYAQANSEIPYLVNSAGEVWAIINGSEPIDPSRILGQSGSGLSMTTLLAIAAGAYFLLRR